VTTQQKNGEMKYPGNICNPFYKNGDELRDILKDELENSEK